MYLAEPSEDGGNPFGQQAIHNCISPMSNEQPTIFGIDLAKSVDWTVIIGLDNNGYVSVFDRFQLPWEETVQRIRTLVGNNSAVIDSTGVGDPIVEKLQRDLSNIEGFKFSASSKQMLMEGLSLAIQTQSIKYPDNEIVNELSSFAFEYTKTGVRYSAPSGLHDDCVMALALAVHGINNVAGQGLW
ncbi:MAG TPA: hypothetical protein DCS66_13345 [Flavobacteriaceae bacterium]|nr:hypothetical protein [Flavobacteriaceae bacterium]